MSNPTTFKLLVPDWQFVSSLGSEDPADFLRRKWSSEQPAAKARTAAQDGPEDDFDPTAAEDEPPSDFVKWGEFVVSRQQYELLQELHRGSYKYGGKGYGSSAFPSGIFELWDAANGRLPEPKPKRKPWASVRDFLAPKPGHSLSELDAETLKADLARARAAAADVGCEPTEAGLHDYLTACWGGNEARHRTFAEVFGTVWFK